MRCEKCGNDYPSQYYFATPSICKDCYQKLTDDEKRAVDTISSSKLMEMNELELRVGFGRRLGAYLLDMLIFYIIFGIAFVVTGLYDAYKDSFVHLISNPQLMAEFQTAIMPITFIITFLYYSLEVFIAATPGKMILGIQIANKDRTFASTFSLLQRFLYKHSATVISLVAFLLTIKWLDFVSGLISFVFIIGCFFVLSQKRLAFHDMLSKTAVFYKSSIIEVNE